ncbi:MAG: hypothetical protein MZU84_04475 [Sphingobacterium sp.]|nr:hypothetical protein [Sphingobacterium sp.]
MTGGAVVLTACAGVMAALALGHLLGRTPQFEAGRRGRWPRRWWRRSRFPLMLRGPGSDAPDTVRWPAAAPDIAGPAGDRRVS